MPLRLASGFMLTAALSGCASYHGVYSPDCIAYAGDRISLEDGRFVWDKFTDQVKVDEAGQRVDRYPDYPVQGRYLLRDGQLTFVPETDVPLPTLQLVERGRQHYLLTPEQYQVFRDTGDLASCALILGGHP